MRMVWAKTAAHILEFQRTAQLVYIHNIKADINSVTKAKIRRYICISSHYGSGL